jgi:NAD-dependent SIR2 family protein deacetylase
MTDDRTLRAIPRVAELIANADALLITAGAGMGVDSGLPDFRGKDGFWRAYPALGKRGISFEQMAQPRWFFEEPETAWAFYGHRQQLYRDTKPHDGFRILLEWGRAMPGEYFVVTSNVDGQFEKAGFLADRILEKHGSIHRLQCTRPCTESIWLDAPKDLEIDLETITARGRLPRCPECGAVARPNLLMFGDPDWLANVRHEQQQRYREWLATVRGRRLVVIELGAGSAIATIRTLGDGLASERDRVTLVRVNPDAADADMPVIPLRMGALEALTRIEAALPTQFRERRRAVESEKPASTPAVDPLKSIPAAISSAPPLQDLKGIKSAKVYSKAWKITLPSGWVGWVDHIDVRKTYLGMLEGLPFAHLTDREIEDARTLVRRNFHGPEPVLIPPVLVDPDSDTPILPPLRFIAQISSHAEIADGDHGSWMNLIWFAEIDDTKSIKAFVEEALIQVDWEKQATGFEV